MVRIPDNIQELRSYQPGKPIAQLVSELNLNRWAVLWNNENNLGPSPKVREHLETAFDRLHLYPDPASIQLRSALAELNGCEVNQVLIDNGSESLLDNLFRAFLQDGDEMLTCDGTFVALYIWAKSNNKHVERLPLQRGFRFDIPAILEHVTSRTKAIYLANPNNPTGSMTSSRELKELIEGAGPDILIVVDEAYYEYARVLDDDYPDSFALRRPNVVTLRTFSKAYGLAGVRVGYALGPANLIEAMSKVKMTFAPSNLAQAAALGALSDPEHLEHVVRVNKAALQHFYTALHEAELKYVPSYANFVMVDLETPAFAQAFTERLMRKGVFVRLLTAFGLPQCVRISTGTEAENELFVEALK